MTDQIDREWRKKEMEKLIAATEASLVAACVQRDELRKKLDELRVTLDKVIEAERQWEMAREMFRDVCGQDIYDSGQRTRPTLPKWAGRCSRCGL